MIGFKNIVRAKENNIAWHVKNATETLFFEVGRSDLCRMEDLYTERINEAENRWVKRRVCGQFHRDIEDKTGRAYDSYGRL